MWVEQNTRGIKLQVNILIGYCVLYPEEELLL